MSTSTRHFDDVDLETCRLSPNYFLARPIHWLTLAYDGIVAQPAQIAVMTIIDASDGSGSGWEYRVCRQLAAQEAVTGLYGSKR
jgi:hypothetical protein